MIMFKLYCYFVRIKFIKCNKYSRKGSYVIYYFMIIINSIQYT